MQIRSPFLSVSWLAFGTWLGAFTVLQSRAADFSFGELTLTVPDGFQVEQVAGPPLVDRPIMGDFDEEGRLFVAESSGSNAPVDVQLKEKPHRILRLEDTDGDGVFDTREVYAEDLMFPEGVLYHRGSVYVSAPPVIWKLTDTDGDGRADARQVWHDGKTLTGCANDLHGPYLGPDGWIYWCKGAFAEQTYPQHQGPPLTSRAAHIFRKPLEGGLVEPVMTGGMDNPVELVFSPEGERFFTTTFLQHPGGGRRDGIIHALYGGVYGKDHGVLQGHPRTGDLMPVMTHHGPAASCGLLHYESAILGPEFQGNLFATLFNMRQVTRHRLVAEGASYRTEDSPFLTGDHIDFHPTDVLESPDGTLLVIDTGGWYKLCCPTSQLPKPEVLGAIYRIRPTTTPGHRDPCGLALEWEKVSPAECLARLADERPAVWKRALDLLAQTAFDPSSLDWKSLPHTSAQQRFLWALTRRGTPEALAVLEETLGSSVSALRHTALHGLGLWRHRAAASRIEGLLADPDPAVRRAAAEALGRLGSATSYPALFQALESAASDRLLEHSLRYALMEIGDEEALLEMVQSGSAGHRADALFALQERRSPLLQPAHWLPFLTHPHLALRKRAWDLAATRPQDAEALAAILPPASELPEEAREALIALAAAEPMQGYLALQLGRAGDRVAAVNLVTQTRIPQVPEAWLPVLTEMLPRPEGSQLLEWLHRLDTVPPVLTETLRTLALQTDREPDERLRILQLLAASPDAFPVNETFALLLEALGTSRPLVERQAASHILTTVALDADRQAALARCLDRTAPLELAALLEFFTHGLAEKPHEPRTSEIAAAALESLGKNASLASLPPGTLERFLQALPAEMEDARANFLRQHQPGDAPRADEERLQALLQSLPAGDIIRGQSIFNSDRAACVTCHAIGYRGGTLGPDLTRIGHIRSRRDLLEAILFPSASLVRSYETLLVTAHDGTSHLGILGSEETGQITLRTGPEAAVTLDRTHVGDMQPVAMSLMPPGLDTLLTEQELADLLTFLETRK